MQTPAARLVLFATTAFLVAVLTGVAVGPVLGQVPQIDVPTGASSTVSVTDTAVIQAVAPSDAVAFGDSVSVQAPKPTTTVAIADTVTLALGPLPPLTTTVNTTKDGFDGRCDAFHCSLRERIIDLNFAGVGGTIRFEIPTTTDTGYDPVTGVFTFQPLPPLPSINSPTIVDGYSQSGASPNTLTGGNNAVLRIEIDGSQVVANAGEHIGLRLIGSTGNTVKGLIINGFDDVGVLLDSTGGHKVEGNWIGLDGDGVTAIGNGVGVDSKTAILNTIGGETPAARNVITGPGTGIRLAAGVGSLVQGNFIGTDKTGTAVVNNGASVGVLIDGTTGNGVLDKFSNGPSMPNVIGGWGTAGVQIVSDATGNFIAGNMIGTDLTGTLDLGNAIGVLINAPGNLVGTGTSAAGNTIAYNTGDGVRVLDGLGNRIRLNSFYENGALAIDLGGDGVTPNDPGDADSSPNGFQNFPVLLEINSLSGKATSTLDSTTSTEFQIDFYTSAACDPSGFGEARTIVGGVTVTTNASGTVVFGANLDR